MRKTLLGILITLIVVIGAIPAAYWFIISAIDNAAGFEPVLPPGAAAILAATSLLIGLFSITWAYSYLHFIGQGSPVEVFGYELHPTKALVTTGPYAYLRNPMILGELFLLLTVAFMERSVSGLFLLPVVAVSASIYVRLVEEKGLYQKFGKNYVEYKRNVPLLIPRVTPYMHESATSA